MCRGDSNVLFVFEFWPHGSEQVTSSVKWVSETPNVCGENCIITCIGSTMGQAEHILAVTVA